MEQSLSGSSKRVKHLENGDTTIISGQEESDEELVHNAPTRRSRRYEKSPVRMKLALATAQETPRRSARKSIKPPQDYDEIVNKRALRSVTKASESSKDETDEVEEPTPKWTPAKVGRVSQKRGRRSRKTVNTKVTAQIGGTDGEVERKAVDGDGEEGGERKGDSNESEKDENMEMVTAKEAERKKEEVTISIGEVVEAMSVMVECEKGEEISKLVEVKDDQNKKNEIKLEIEGVKNQENINQLNDDQDQLKEDQNKENTIQSDDKAHPDKENIIGVNVKEKVNEAAASINVATKKEPLRELLLEEVKPSVPKVFGVIDLSDEEEHFGSYLKSNKIDIEDLGLNPLIDDDEQGGTSTTKLEDVEEKSHNSTFEINDCIVVDEETDDVKMESLQVSDDDDDEEQPNEELPQIIITPADEVPQVGPANTPLVKVSTPRRYSKVAERLPTPFKRKPGLNRTTKEAGCFGEDQQELIEIKAEQPPIVVSVSTMEPKDIVLRSIRKRSLSVCIGDPTGKRTVNRVTFHSPANQTAVIEELDMKMIKSVKKEVQKRGEENKNFVVQRRKRSMSFDESALNSAQKIKGSMSGTTPRKQLPTPQKVVLARTKLPNFAAIHKKQFDKMPNLVEYVTQKAERAKVLTNSNVKKQIGLAEKGALRKQLNTSHADKQKVAENPNLSTTKLVLHTNDEERQRNLPNPRMGIVKPMPKPVVPMKTRAKLQPPPQQQQTKPTTPAKKPVLRTEALGAPRQPLRPAFNLSTSVQPHTSSAVTIFSKAATNSGIFNSTNTTNTTTMATHETKVSTRRQRHMEMFKGRAGAGAAATRKNGEIIRGVRSNRRFELQMLHRQQQDN